MAKLNKNKNHTELKKYFLGKGTVEICLLPKLGDIPKEGFPIGNFELMSHWIPLNKAASFSFNVECSPDPKCPICEILKPKTKWQRIKEKVKRLWRKTGQTPTTGGTITQIRIAKLWKHLNPFI